MRIARTALLSLSLVAWLFVMTGCALLGRDQGEMPKKPTRSVVVLVDLSRSAVDFRGLYRDSLKQIVDDLYHGDFLLVAWITQASIAEPGIVLKESFPPREVAGRLPANPFLRRQAEERAATVMKEENTRLEARKKTLLPELLERALPRADVRRGSEIMGSIAVAANALAGNPRDKSILIILSDMVEDSHAGYNFEREVLSDQRIAEIIALEKAAGRLPNLHNVEVRAVAASHLTRETFYRVRAFWIQYFAACGAKLAPENYGSLLHGF